MLAWLLAPIDPQRAHEVGFALSWHARLMVLAWGVLFPAGILAARFFKVMPRQDWPKQVDNLAWWHSHRTMQYCGGAVVLAALLFIWQAPRFDHQAGYHALIGWAVVVCTAAQFLGGWLRGTKGGPTERAPDGSLRGDHYDMTPRRLVFEYAHKTLGYVAFLLACAAVYSGLWQANAPRWFWTVLTAWWVFLVVVFVLLQRRGMAFDTYQAIWGPDEKHPGNKRRPVGIGVRRGGRVPDK